MLFSFPWPRKDPGLHKQVLHVAKRLERIYEYGIDASQSLCTDNILCRRVRVRVWTKVGPPFVLAARLRAKGRVPRSMVPAPKADQTRANNSPGQGELTRVQHDGTRSGPNGAVDGWPNRHGPLCRPDPVLRRRLGRHRARRRWRKERRQRPGPALLRLRHGPRHVCPADRDTGPQPATPQTGGCSQSDALQHGAASLGSCRDKEKEHERAESQPGSPAVAPVQHRKSQSCPAPVTPHAPTGWHMLTEPLTPFSLS